nr:TlpA disulfide reductase family protein [uncultured Mucilaginibacter sp.]
MKTKMRLLGLLCLFFQVSAQTSPDKKYLKVGDKMPDIVIANIMNSKIKSAKISDYKGKLILLDFWATHCIPCVEAFPEMDSLQRVFAGKLQVLLVNSARNKESERSVNLVLNRMKELYGRPIKVPIVSRDTALTGQFNFRGIPFVVWISPEGKVIGMTDKTVVTGDNIRKIIAGERVSLVPRPEPKFKPAARTQ